MFCTECGGSLPAEAKFCCFCGKPVSVPLKCISSTVTTSTCGSSDQHHSPVQECAALSPDAKQSLEILKKKYQTTKLNLHVQPTKRKLLSNTSDSSETDLYVQIVDKYGKVLKKLFPLDGQMSGKIKVSVKPDTNGNDWLNQINEFFQENVKTQLLVVGECGIEPVKEPGNMDIKFLKEERKRKKSKDMTIYVKFQEKDRNGIKKMLEKKIQLGKKKEEKKIHEMSISVDDCEKKEKKIQEMSISVVDDDEKKEKKIQDMSIFVDDVKKKEKKIQEMSISVDDEEKKEKKIQEMSISVDDDEKKEKKSQEISISDDDVEKKENKSQGISISVDDGEKKEKKIQEMSISVDDEEKKEKKSQEISISDDDDVEIPRLLYKKPKTQRIDKEKMEKELLEKKNLRRKLAQEFIPPVNEDCKKEMFIFNQSENTVYSRVFDLITPIKGLFDWIVATIPAESIPTQFELKCIETCTKTSCRHQFNLTKDSTCLCLDLPDALVISKIVCSTIVK